MSFPSNEKKRKICQRVGACIAVLITLLVVVIEVGSLSKELFALADQLITVFGFLLAICIAASFYFKNRE